MNSSKQRVEEVIMVDSPANAPGAEQVSCFTCRAWFDALRADWCQCVSKERSLVCPDCLRCFCSAPNFYKQRFWAAASEELWQRKLQERRTELIVNPDPVAVTRPLVLVVDDEREIHGVAKRAIDALGYGVVFARNGEEGLQLATEYTPDVILTDALMPKMDGRELCRLVKLDPQLQHIKVFVMTSLYVGRSYRAEGVTHFKADEYLSKPLAPDLLQRLLRKHVEETRPIG